MPVSLKRFYWVGIFAIVFSILVIFLLNIATPLEFVIAQFKSFEHNGRIRWAWLIFSRLLILGCLAGISCLPFVLILRRLLGPVYRFLEERQQGTPVPDSLALPARQRLINLPFLIVPWNIGLWVLFPTIIFTTAVLSGKMDAGAAITFGLRSVMAGMISSGIIFFALESICRKHYIPVLFPDGRLSEVPDTTRLSINLRIKAFFRIGSLLPLANMVMTLFILWWQVDSDTVTAKTYGAGVLIFALVVFVLFFTVSSLVHQLFTRSITDPLHRILRAVKAVGKGDYDTRVPVVSNDEIGVLGDAVNSMIRGLRERDALRDAFGKYVAPEVRDEIISGRIPLDGEYRDVTVMFADLRDFTPLAESNDPKKLVRILNAYFREMSEAVTRHGGLILQFLGDEIYAVFGAPAANTGHPEQAFLAALDMRKRLVALNKTFRSRGRPPLAHGIGIHSGQVVAANIGSPDRLSYLLVGDTVNLASRLQALSRDLDVQVVISADTVARLPRELLPAACVRHTHPVRVKGRHMETDIYLIP